MQRLRLGKEKKKERRRKKIETTAEKYNGLPITMGGDNNSKVYPSQTYENSSTAFFNNPAV